MAVYSDSESLLSEGLPPSYHRTINGSPAGNNNPKGTKWRVRKNTLSSLNVILGLLVIVLSCATLIVTTVPLSSNPLDPPDPLERARIRREWQRERDEFADEKHKMFELRQQWEAEQRQQQEEVKRWTEARRQLSMMWDKPEPARCLAYGVQDYSVRLDGVSVCKIAPLTIQDSRTIILENCEVQAGRVVGHFNLHSEPGDETCRPHWGDMYDKGCISRGPTDGGHRVEARLWGLRRGDDWQEICSTTPAIVNGIEFSHPTICQGGDWGVFVYRDPACRWGNLVESVDATEGDSEDSRST